MTKKLEKPKRLPRQWAVVGYENSGKSTFAAQMLTDMLVVDADGRFEEQYDLLHGQAYLINSIDVEQIVLDINACIARKTSIRTIIVDSLTSIMVPLTSGAMYDNLVGRQVFTSNQNRNKGAAFLEKALVMRLLQGSIRGADTLWVWHLEDSQLGAQRSTHETLPETEVKRLRRSLNAIVRVIQDGQGPYKLKVEWCRYDAGRKGPQASGVELVDEKGYWQGMPEQLDRLFWQTKYGEDSTPVSGKEEKLVVPHSPNALLLLVNQHRDRAYTDVKQLFAVYVERTQRKGWPGMGDDEEWERAYNILIQ